MLLEVSVYFLIEMAFLVGAPLKINMEPKSHLIERKTIFQTSIFRFHVSFQGGVYEHLEGVSRKRLGD